MTCRLSRVPCVALVGYSFSKEIHFERPQCSDDTAVQVGLLIIEVSEATDY